MFAMPSAEAQNRFGELLDLSQREPVQITRRGRPVACVVSMQDMEKWAAYRRQVSAQWLDEFHIKLDASRSAAVRAEVVQLSEDEMSAIVRDARQAVASA
jgi:antitoxin Phd